MGEALCRAFPFVDVVVRGAGEKTLIAVLEGLRSGQRRPHEGLVWRGRPQEPQTDEGAACGTTAPVPGLVETSNLLRRRPAGVSLVPDQAAAVHTVPEVPPAIGKFESFVPDYDDFFDQVVDSVIATRCDLEMPVETSRGCWWYKKKCLFCGRSTDNLRYRVKARKAICDEMEFLAARHRCVRFMVVDPAVLEKEVASVADDAHGKGYDYRVWCQGRVFVDRDVHRRIAQIVDTMFFGIESLSTPVLKLMRKGHTAIQAIVALKRASEMGVKLTHNMIHGFPGERSEHYERLNGWLPAFFHLPPPFQISPMSIDRASVYFDAPAEYGITLQMPMPSDDPVLWLAQASGAEPQLLWDLASQVPADIPRVSGPVIDRTYALVGQWKAGYKRNAGKLWWRRGPNFITIRDERDGMGHSFDLPFPHDQLYMAVDEGATVPEIERHLADRNVAIEGAEIERVLSQLVSERVLYEEDGRFVSLALKHRPS